ncbi:dynein regulatory complex subunit 4 [Nothobranchius furzeri]|uniref:Dynein regulatory complex subunit 4 n=1 Tax=Nothobranchius furzeri TaxID=105023 RepID=A0A9D3BL55_NOTFU|nr:transcript variant X1 [Nothobranchius furzeri]KAF7211899.1 transcript variant X2 [Nothobranchius furzeri]
MSTHKKGSVKKPAIARPHTLINGLTKEEVSKEQMEEHIAYLREELDREREERNYFQLERDKVATIHEITERKLKEVKAEIKVVQKATEDDKARHEVEIKVYKQKMKHLLCEHQNTISELTADRLLSAEVMQKNQDLLEAELRSKVKAAMVDVQDLDHKTHIEKLELEHTKKMAATQEDWERQITEAEVKHEECLHLQQEELDDVFKSMTSKQELSWNNHINDLKEIHEKTLKDLAMTFNIKEECKKIEKLKQENKERLTELDQLGKMLSIQEQSNQLLSERLSEVKEQIYSVEEKLKYTSYTKRASHVPGMKALKKLKRDYDVLQQRFSELQLERDELSKSVPQRIQSVQDETEDVIRQLESKLQTLADRLEKTQAQLDAVLSAPNLDHTALTEVMNKAQENKWCPAMLPSRI